jgi:hypothetical protein
MSKDLPNPPTPAELEILQVLWRLREGEAMRLSEIHREIGEYRERHHQQAPAVTTVSSTLRSALGKGLLRDVRLVGGKVQSAPPASGRGLVASRSPQTAYQAAVTASDVLLPQLRQLIELCPESERKALLLAVLGAFGVPAGTVKEIKASLGKG